MGVKGRGRGEGGRFLLSASLHISWCRIGCAKCHESAWPGTAPRRRPGTAAAGGGDTCDGRARRSTRRRGTHRPRGAHTMSDATTRPTNCTGRRETDGALKTCNARNTGDTTATHGRRSDTRTTQIHKRRGVEGGAAMDGHTIYC